jgi:hypothetical protein
MREGREKFDANTGKQGETTMVWGRRGKVKKLKKDQTAYLWKLYTVPQRQK